MPGRNHQSRSDHAGAISLRPGKVRSMYFTNGLSGFTFGPSSRVQFVTELFGSKRTMLEPSYLNVTPSNCDPLKET
jgi:hypothetical protein